MAEKKIIAVVGATGAQGGGLVRAILDDTSGGFAARALTRDANSRQGEGAGEARRRGRRRRRRRRRQPASARSRAPTARYCVTFFWEHFSPEKETAAGAHHGRRRRRRPACKHVDLVDARGHAQVGAAHRQPHADAAWASTRCRTSTPRARPNQRLHRARRADDVPADVVLLGEPDLLRHGAEEGARTASSRSRCRWATRSCPASPPRTSASAPTASSRRAATSSARPSASPAST